MPKQSQEAQSSTSTGTSSSSSSSSSSTYKSHTEAPKEQPFYHRESDIGGFNNKKGRSKYSKRFSITDPINWAKNLKAQTPVLLQVGKPTPKAVISFGGCGLLCTYSLGVVQYLLAEKKDFIRQCYVLGTGSGTIPAVALCGEDSKATPEAVKEYIVDNMFDISNEPRRIDVMKKAAEQFLPEDIHERMNGRCSLAVGMSNRDMNFMKQPPHQQLFGAMLSSFESAADVGEIMIGATAPNATLPYLLRGELVTRATWKCISSELDQYVRHIYIHGFSGYPHSTQHTRHNSFFGRHGFLANSHWHWQTQMLCAHYPMRVPMMRNRHREMLREAFEKGFHDARRYERWEEDVYLTAKPDRSPSENTDLRTIRAAIFGARDKPPEGAKL